MKKRMMKDKHLLSVIFYNDKYNVKDYKYLKF
jgi:hypothetical protein